MKNAFFEFYPLEPTDYEKLWNEALIIPDTNVLLDLTRIRPKAAAEVFSVFEAFKDRLWLPHQVGLEFHKRRHSIAPTSKGSFKKLRDLYEDSRSDLEDKLNRLTKEFRTHPSIDFEKHKANAAKLFKSILVSIDAEEAALPARQYNDEIIIKISKYFDGHVGVPFDEGAIAALRAEGKKRFETKVPPGYKDGEFSGDFLLWKQIISYAKERGNSVIFITEDAKED